MNTVAIVLLHLHDCNSPTQFQGTERHHLALYLTKRADEILSIARSIEPNHVLSFFKNLWYKHACSRPMLACLFGDYRRFNLLQSSCNPWMLRDQECLPSPLISIYFQSLRSMIL